MEELGRLPQHLWDKWEWRWEYYEEDGTRKWGPMMPKYGMKMPLAKQIDWMRTSMTDSPEQLSQEDKAGLLQLLEACFKYETWERITAEKVLELDWIKKLRADYEMDELQHSMTHLGPRTIYHNSKGAQNLKSVGHSLGSTDGSVVKQNPQERAKARSRSI